VLSILLFYVFLLVVLVIVAIFSFRFLRRWGRRSAVVGTLLMLVSAILFWPIPIHGGLLFLGEALYDEWGRDRARLLQENSTIEKPARITVGRFAGILAVTLGTRIDDGWVEVAYDNGHAVVLHEASGLIWSHWLLLNTHQSRPALAQAKDRCETREPPGYWALATTAEDVLAWQDSGDSVISRPNTSTMSYVVDQHIGLEIPTYQLKARHTNNQQAIKSELFSVRCVARSANAPTGGYTQADVELKLWNRYQLNRLIKP
jgi:hypothetical protein